MNALRTRQRLYRVLADHDPLFELGRELPHARQNVQAYIMETKPDQDSSFWSSDQKRAFQMVDPARESWSTKATSEDLWFGIKVLERVASDINRTDEGRQSGTQGETSTRHGKSMRGLKGQHMSSVASEIAARFCKPATRRQAAKQGGLSLLDFVKSRKKSPRPNTKAPESENPSDKSQAAPV